MRAGLTFQLLVAAFALVQALRYGRRALRFVLPGARALPAGEAPASPRRLRLAAELEALGFAPLGAWEERDALGARLAEADAHASAALGAYADVVARPGPEGAGVVFLTPFADGAAVLTATFARPPLARDRVLAGGMEGAALPAALAAHQVAARRFAEAHGAPAVDPSLEGRLAAAAAWDRLAGRGERRRAGALPFGIVLVAFALLAGAAQALLHR